VQNHYTQRCLWNHLFLVELLFTLFRLFQENYLIIWYFHNKLLILGYRFILYLVYYQRDAYRICLFLIPIPGFQIKLFKHWDSRKIAGMSKINWGMLLVLPLELFQWISDLTRQLKYHIHVSRANTSLLSWWVFISSDLGRNIPICLSCKPRNYVWCL